MFAIIIRVLFVIFCIVIGFYFSAGLQPFSATKSFWRFLGVGLGNSYSTS